MFPQEASYFTQRAYAFTRNFYMVVTMLIRMAEKPMGMKDTDDVMDEQQAKPMGPGPDPDAEKEAKELKEKIDDTSTTSSKWWMWVAVFVVGAICGFVIGAWLI